MKFRLTKSYIIYQMISKFKRIKKKTHFQKKIVNFGEKKHASLKMNETKHLDINIIFYLKKKKKIKIKNIFISLLQFA